MEEHEDDDTKAFCGNDKGYHDHNHNCISPRSSLFDSHTECTEILFDPTTLDPLDTSNTHDEHTRLITTQDRQNSPLTERPPKTDNANPHAYSPSEAASSASTMLPSTPEESTPRKDNSERNKEQVLLQEIQYTYYNLLERYVREKKRVILLEAELLEGEMTKINSDIATYYDAIKRKTETAVLKEGRGRSGLLTHPDAPGPASRSGSARDRVSSNYVMLDRNGTNVAHVGILSPERKEDTEFVHKNSTIDPKDAIALFFVVLITFLIVGIIVDNL